MSQVPVPEWYQQRADLGQRQRVGREVLKALRRYIKAHLDDLRSDPWTGEPPIILDGNEDQIKLVSISGPEVSMVVDVKSAAVIVQPSVIASNGTRISTIYGFEDASVRGGEPEVKHAATASTPLSSFYLGLDRALLRH